MPLQKQHTKTKSSLRVSAEALAKVEGSSATAATPYITSNAPLKNRTWFQTGGPARYLAEPKTINELSESLSFAQANNLPLFILGDGANILVSDDGFNGLVLRSKIKDITLADQQGDTIFLQVGAGVSMPDLIIWCLERNISGLEEFSGIPGTIGGSIYINLHYYEFLIEQFLHCARVMDKQTGAVQSVSTDWFGFGYNQSKLHDGQHILVDATFKLKRVSAQQAAFAKGRSIEIIRHRHKRYPHERTCGSFFRNFMPEEVTFEREGKKMIHVAYYLDRVGVRGELKVGNAIVSHQHANMVVNQGHATSNDIITLARLMQERVRDTFGIMPQPECRLIGFNEWPLL